MENQKYDSSWDLGSNDEGYDEDAADRKDEEWEKYMPCKILASGK